MRYLVAVGVGLVVGFFFGIPGVVLFCAGMLFGPLLDGFDL